MVRTSDMTEPAPNTPLKPRVRLWWVLAISLTAPLCALSLAGSLGGFWLLENIAAFRVQYFLFLSLASVTYALGKHRLVALAAGLFALLNLSSFVPLYFSDSDAPEARAVSFRVLLFNVRTENRQYQRTLDYIQEVEPDIVLFLEVDEGWLKA